MPPSLLNRFSTFLSTIGRKINVDVSGGGSQIQSDNIDNKLLKTVLNLMGTISDYQKKAKPKDEFA